MDTTRSTLHETRKGENDTAFRLEHMNESNRIQKVDWPLVQTRSTSSRSVADQRCFCVHPVDRKALQDRALILVGSGTWLQELATRRLAAGGRLCVIESGESTVVEKTEVASDSPLDVWDPPPAARGVDRSELAVRLNAESPVHGIKCGPDVAQVPLGARLEVLTTRGEQVGVRAVAAADGMTLWQLNGLVVVDPSEADAREMDVSVRDREAQPLITVSIRGTFITSLLWLAFMVPGMIFTVYQEADSPPNTIPWWRALLWSGNVFFYVSTSCVFVCTVALAGDRAEPKINMACSLLSAVLSAGVCLAGSGAYLAATAGASLSPLFSLLHYHSTLHRFPARSLTQHAIICAVFMTLTLGVVYIYGVINIAYVALLGTGHGWLAALWLPCSVNVIEYGTVTLATWSYRTLVVGARTKAIGSVAGDQRMFLIVIVMLAHGWAESTRLAAVCAGTIRSSDSWEWLMSLCVGVCLNVPSRTGWSMWLRGYFLKRLGRQRMSLGTAMGRLHANTRRSCGYPRFASVMLFVATRFALHNDLDPNSPRYAFFNQMFLTAYLAMLVFEVIEDVLVHITAPPPFMENHIRHYMSFSAYDLRQLLVLQWGTKDGEVKVVGWDADARKPSCPLLLHGARVMPLSDLAGLTCVLANVTTFSFELMLGSGYVRGLCEQPLDSVGEAIMQWLRTDVPFPCH